VAIEPEDLVLVNQRGLTFYARVLGVEQHGRLTIAPLERTVRARSARPEELRGHWSHQGDPRPGAGDARQGSFDHLIDR
jgi:hypothetical protein